MRQRRTVLMMTDDPLDDLVVASRLAAPHELAGLIDLCARRLGAVSATAYLADLQQQVLVPFVGPEGPGDDEQLVHLSVDATLAGRAYQSYVMQVQESGVDGLRAWCPLLLGTDRMGVLAITLDTHGPLTDADAELVRCFEKLAATTAVLLASMMPFGDTLIRLRRRTTMGLASEIQYSLLPPLTFSSRSVSLAAALEPCYHVAGDTIDYAVDAGMARVAVFDGMGHGLHSAQCAVLTLAAYRNARRADRSLTETLHGIDEALLAGLGGEVFTTAVVIELDTDTGLLQWVNAGHPEPLLIRGGKLIKSLYVEPRPPLGLGYLLEEPDAEVGVEQLEPGDLLLLFTDGVVEARSPSGEFFGAERLAELVIRHLAGGLPAPETMRRVVRNLLDHHQDQLSDDATLLLVEWRGGNDL